MSLRGALVLSRSSLLITWDCFDDLSLRAPFAKQSPGRGGDCFDRQSALLAMTWFIMRIAGLLLRVSDKV